MSSTYQRYACGTFLPYSLYLHRLFQKAYGRAFFRTDRDVRGSTQKRRFCFAKTRVQKCTRMYTSGQAISKGLRRSMLYDMLLLKIVLNVYPIRLRFISARLLASVASIFKSAGCKGISFVAVKKLILNVSEPPWRAVGMSVVLRSSVFVLQTRSRLRGTRLYIL